jgi:hypothetical protein
MFYQNSAAREPPWPVPSLAAAIAARALRSPTAFRPFPGMASQFLRNTQHCFKEWIRVARIEHRSGMAYRMEIFHLVDLPSLEPGEFSQSRRVESASSRRSRE